MIECKYESSVNSYSIGQVKTHKWHLAEETAEGDFRMANISAKTKKQGERFADICATVISGTISIYLLLLITVFPLILHNNYIDILVTKYQCYYLITIGMFVVVSVTGVGMLFIDLIEYHGEHASQLLKKLYPRNWKTTFRMADFAGIAFWLVLLVSTLQSRYLYESFWGNEGRYTGLFLLTLYVVSYFVISHFWKMKGWVLDIFLLTSLIICYIGITDYFQMDILNFRVRIKPEQSTIFTSTLGNINTYTAYLALMLGVAAAMFATAKKTVRVIWYYLCMTVGFFAIIMGCSDNAYLALGALFGFLPFLLFKSRTGIKRYLLMLATFGSVIQCVDFINQAYADIVIGLDSLFRILADFSGLMYVVAALWMIYIAVIVYDKKNQKASDVIGDTLVWIWGGFLVICACIICFLIYDANVAGNAERYGELGNYLVFHDGWGTNRGYIWRKSVELFQEFPFRQKLLGYGPETFGILTTENFLVDMFNSAQGQIFDNAHNEYLQYLVTTGVLGLVTYVIFLILAVWRMIVRRNENAYIVGCLFAVLCYCAQALVNLNLPITAPIMWLMLSVGMAGSE